MLDLLRSVTLAGAALTTGLTAGLFFAFRCAVMPGLARTDDRTVVATMTAINVAIINRWFLASFGGGLVLTMAAVALHLPIGGPDLPWLIAAAVGSLATVAITGLRNVPLNERLATARVDGDPAQLATARTAFEAPWNRWHRLRTVTSVAAFGCVVLATLVR